MALDHAPAPAQFDVPQFAQPEMAVVAFQLPGVELVQPDLNIQNPAAQTIHISETGQINRVEAQAAQEKEPIGKQFPFKIDASGSGMITVMANNFGKGPNGEYNDKNVPASVWIGGEDGGEGLTPEQSLAFAIKNGMLPANATIADLEKIGTDMYTAIRDPRSGRMIIFDGDLELKGIQNWSGKETEITFDVIAEAKKRGFTLTLADLPHLEGYAQAKGLPGEGVSIGGGVKVVSRPVTPPTTTTSTTTTSTPATTTTTSTIPRTTTTSTVPVTTSTTTTVPKTTTTTTPGTTTTTGVPVTTTTTLVVRTPETPSTPDTPQINRGPKTPNSLADTGLENAPGRIRMAFAGIALGAIMLAGRRRRDDNARRSSMSA